MNLKDKNLYYIGGVVRDELLCKESFDIDLTYDGDAINFAKNIKDAQILRINEPFGTVKIRYQGEDIDIASTRSEIYPDKGHLPVVEKIGCSLKEDVMRRDFTINAMAKSTLTGEIIDYTGGLEDIKNRKLRVLHDNSFIDDPTRIVRGLKFSVRFGFEMDEHTKYLQDNYLKNINYDMSYKRLQKELKETFNLNSREAFKKFAGQGIYKLIDKQDFEIPEYDFSGLIEKYKPENIWIIYIGLLPQISNLPLTKEETKIVESYKMISLTDKAEDFDIYKAFINLPLESIIMYSVRNSNQVEKFLSKLKNIKLNITGEDLKNIGISPSAKYQECFDYILEKKIKNPEIGIEEEISLAKDFFA